MLEKLDMEPKLLWNHFDEIRKIPHGSKNEEKIREYVRDIIEQGVDVVSPGSDFWIKTPSKNIRTMVEATKEFGVIRR